METNERLRRVEKMEQAMDALSAAAEELERALESWEAARDALRTLSEYIDGGLWREDFEADEAGELPADLKRGVLSEDGLYDLLGRAEELQAELKRLGEER